MKKLLGMLVLGLLWCNVSFAKVYDFKCSSYHTRTVVNEPYSLTEDYNSKYDISGYVIEENVTGSTTAQTGDWIFIYISVNDVFCNGSVRCNSTTGTSRRSGCATATGQALSDEVDDTEI